MMRRASVAALCDSSQREPAQVTDDHQHEPSAMRLRHCDIKNAKVDDGLLFFYGALLVYDFNGQLRELNKLSVT
jgi:hypothetical protein